MPIFCALAISYHLEDKARKASRPQLSVQVETSTALTNLQSLEALDIDLYAEDLQQIRRRVRQLSWVQDASVRRVWPDRLYLYVKSRQPLAFWGEDLVLSTDGALVEKTALSAQLSLPVIHAPRAYRGEAVEKFAQTLQMLDKVGLELREFRMQEWGELSLVLTSGQQIMLGSSLLEERLERLQRLMATNDASLHQAAQIDLRYLSAVAVRNVD